MLAGRASSSSHLHRVKGGTPFIRSSKDRANTKHA